MKITIYRTLNNQSQRNIKKFFEGYDIEHVEQNIINETMTWKQFKEMLMYSENGLEELLSSRSKAYNKFKQEGLQIEDMTIREVYELVVENPTLLRSPITVGKGVTMVGYTDEIDVFVPREYRKKEMQAILKNERCTETVGSEQWAV